MPTLDYQGSNADVDEINRRNQEFVDTNEFSNKNRDFIASRGEAMDTSQTKPDQSCDEHGAIDNIDSSRNGTMDLHKSLDMNETFDEDNGIQSDALGEGMSQEDLDKEREALTYLRRLSMQGTDDPDLHTDWSVMMSPPESESDASTLFWVPADLHPEVNPNGWKDFLDLQVKNLKHPKQMDTNATPLQHIRSLRRRSSLLSRQVKADDAAQNYQDGSPIIEKKNIQRGKSLHLQDLEHLESLARNPKKMESLVDSMRSEPPEDSPILVSPNQFLQRSSRTTIRRSGASIKTINRGKASTLLGNRSPFAMNKDGLSRSLSVLRPSSSMSRRDEQKVEAPSTPPLSKSLQDNAEVKQNNSDLKYIDSATDSDVVGQMPDSKTQDKVDDISKEGEDLVSSPEQLPEFNKSQQNEIASQTKKTKDSEIEQDDFVSPSLHPSPGSKSDEIVQTNPTPAKDKFEENQMEVGKPSESTEKEKSDPVPKQPTTANHKPPSSPETKKLKKPWGRLFTSNDHEKDQKKDKTKKKGEEQSASQSSPGKDGIFGSLFSSKKKSAETSSEKPITNLRPISRRPAIPKEERINDQEAPSTLLNTAANIPNADKSDKPEDFIPDKDYYWSRFPICTERAIYRLSHIKLSNAQRPLVQQVLLSNFMYSYLDLISRISATRNRIQNNPRPSGPRRSEFSAENVKNELENLSYHFGDQRRRSVNRKKPPLQHTSKKGLKSG
ncbi:serine/threonine protein phosphatase PP2A regulatory subunit, Zds1 [Schizosaccharomyces osmophilus]|uniref:Serine/threonine protein phosphatase PP2A regulatory subunit, Zds1 n=1 Tax=Schizosaccharomyces osmophilus TaxID=2545709 RepID=A0AAE9WD16_9SCHI|nr:serine/threonine protein phosphatase PP2A regulatory subunit, Zds1 [Schizosaccharomyces osmophilus]WBW74111.1 serine/threonine protein phosphatase PP2A regulatory subunit, Zds1 [Schizosaccharomyces osmophilus]